MCVTVLAVISVCRLYFPLLWSPLVCFVCLAVPVCCGCGNLSPFSVDPGYLPMTHTCVSSAYQPCSISNPVFQALITNHNCFCGSTFRPTSEFLLVSGISCCCLLASLSNSVFLVPQDYIPVPAGSLPATPDSLILSA